MDDERLVRTQVRRIGVVGINDEEDLCQEGRLALLKAEKTFNEQLGIKFETYASRVIYNHLLDVCRKDKMPWEEELPLEEPTGEPLEKNIEHQHRLRLLRKVLADCSEIERAIFKAYWQGYAYKEIGDIFDVTPKKIDNTIQKIKKRVQSYNED